MVSEIDLAHSEFDRLAAEALVTNILTMQEINILCHKGTRKAGYWTRHLLDLKEYLKIKIERLPTEKRTERIDNLLKRC